MKRIGDNLLLSKGPPKMQVDLTNAPAGNLLPFLNRPKNPRNFFEALPLLTNELGKIIDPVFSFLWSLSSSLSSSLLSSLSSSLSSLSSSQSNIFSLFIWYQANVVGSSSVRTIHVQTALGCHYSPVIPSSLSDSKKNPKRSNACVSLMLTAHGILPGVNYPDSEREASKRFVERISSTKQLHPL